MKKSLNTNLEIYNYLNLVDRRLGKIYKHTGYNSLPNDFDVNEEKFKEILIIAQFRNNFQMPSFVFEDKKHFKRRLKTCLKNFKHILKKESYKDFCSKDFAKYLGIYFDMCKEITSQILKETNDHDFDEVASWQEIVNLNPILGEYIEVLFEEKVNFEDLFKNLERKYKKSYAEKVALLEKKENKKAKKQRQIVEDLNRAKKSNKLEKSAKIEEKTAKIAQKTAKKREIQQIRTDIRKTKKESNQSKTDKQK